MQTTVPFCVWSVGADGSAFDSTPGDEKVSEMVRPRAFTAPRFGSCS